MTHRGAIKKSIQTIAGASLASAMSSLAQTSETGTGRFDVIIKNGMIYDGTLNSPYRADIGINKDKIVSMGDLSGLASKTIDAGGQIVTPGFIDVHTHCDLTFKQTGWKRYLSYLLPSWKGNYNYIYQGVTTVVTGNCGYGYTDTEKWLGMVDSIGFGSNVYHLAPHGMIREETFGPNQPRQPSRSQMDTIKGRIDEEMQKGAAGMSVGLEYAPGLMATTDELIELSKVVQKYGGLFTIHMRDESGKMIHDEVPAVLKSIQEAIEVCRHAEVSMEISHLKIAEPINDTSASQLLDLIGKARQEGLPVMADQYPYVASSTYISALLPDAMKTSDSIRDEYKTRTGRKDVARAIESIFEYIPPDKMLITMFPGNQKNEGKTVLEIAEMEGHKPSDAFVEMVCTKQAPMAVFFDQKTEVLQSIMPGEYVITASDGWTVPKGMTKPHPRVYGTFPRKLKKYAIDEKTLEINQAIRSMTSMPAEKFNMINRGILAPNNYADIAVIDLDKITDQATFQDPHQYAQGVVHLFVNGVQAIENGKATGNRGGKTLKRT